MRLQPVSRNDLVSASDVHMEGLLSPRDDPVRSRVERGERRGHGPPLDVDEVRLVEGSLLLGGRLDWRLEPGHPLA